HSRYRQMLRTVLSFMSLLIVVVILGTLPTMPIPMFSITSLISYYASLQSLLCFPAPRSSDYFADSVKYTATTACTTPPTAGAVNFCVTTGNNLGVVGLAAGSGGWSVTITNNNLTTPLVKCAIFMNTAVLAPAVSEGARACK